MKNLLLALFCLIALFGFGQQNKFKVGDSAPVFTIKTHDGQNFSLSDELKNGSIVLIFYRGYWCPYCNKELKALSDSLSFIKNRGASVVAISPESDSFMNKTIEKTNLNFRVISDEDNAIMNKYGVSFTVDDKTVEKYKGYGVDFSIVNANRQNVLPVPAVYIINKKGLFKYVYFNADYTKRPSVAEILSFL